MAKAENTVKGSHKNITDMWFSATESSIREGYTWYTDAHNIAKQVSELCGTTDIRVGAGILAALSPQMEWGENIAEALKFASLGYSKKQTGANNAKAEKIRAGQDPAEVLGGLKVKAFYEAIVEPFGDGNPVIDRHALTVYYGKPVSKRDRNRAFSNARVIERLQWSYKKSAKDISLVLGYTVHYNVVQAVTWVQHRKDKGLVKEIEWENNQKLGVGNAE